MTLEKCIEHLHVLRNQKVIVIPLLIFAAGIGAAGTNLLYDERVAAMQVKVEVADRAREYAERRYRDLAREKQALGV